MRTTGARLLLPALMIGVLAGCSSPDGHLVPVVTPPDASEQQLDALDDGRISEEEYTAGYKDYLACLLEEGYEVEELGRPSTVYDYAIPDGAVQSGADQICYDKHFYLIDVNWQDQNPPWTEVGEILKECLAEAGLPTDGDENALQERMVENGLDVRECLGFDPLPDPADG